MNVEAGHRDRAGFEEIELLATTDEAWARRPSTLIALTFAGTCSMSPVRAATRERISSSETVERPEGFEDLAFAVVGGGGRSQADRRLVGLRRQ